MDADYDPSADHNILGLKSTKKKKKNKFAQALARKKPNFDPGETNTKFQNIPVNTFQLQEEYYVVDLITHKKVR